MFLGVYPRKSKTYVHTRLIHLEMNAHTNQNVEITQMYINSWKDKQNVVYFIQWNIIQP